MSRPTRLILASTSIYRKTLLERLRLPFEVVAPRVDETQRAGEKPADLAQRLAADKSLAVAGRFPQAVVIGSDQVADLDGVALGKPGAHDAAVDQLRRLSGREVLFQTAVAVTCHERSFHLVGSSVVRVRFRRLGEREIEDYLRAEQPYDCAGSAKSEGLGIALLEAVESDDPTALIGLPLIRTAEMLRRAGVDVVASAASTAP